MQFMNWPVALSWQTRSGLPAHTPQLQFGTAEAGVVREASTRARGAMSSNNFRRMIPSSQVTEKLRMLSAPVGSAKIVPQAGSSAQPLAHGPEEARDEEDEAEDEGDVVEGAGGGAGQGVDDRGREGAAEGGEEHARPGHRRGAGQDRQRLG